MSKAVDLDALTWEQQIRPNGDVVAILAVGDFRALIQRLRETEAENRNLLIVKQANEVAETDPTGAAKTFSRSVAYLEARIAQLEAELLNQQQLATDWQQRIARLERVREATQEIISWSTALYVETKDREYWTAIRLVDAERLRAALAAMEEK